MQKQKFYSAIASKLGAIVTCQERANNSAILNPASNESMHWNSMSRMHVDAIRDLVKQHAPSGSGFDSGTKLDFDASKPNRLVFKADFHHMSEHGYDGWTEHQIIVTADLAFGFVLRITGRDRNQIKDYISDTFHHLGSIEV